ncbi:nicotinate-nucleotide--dimethylbenzimidazole phosphoribosyltransferase [Salsipaludibacter albus]|uniref:nicotinate-nucleotide--dimethylbenzimidazole phosphoribosyltransferase n=1 Tax=Salsipaludibacter albus TaxID=2849650 RepID=UPI001EE4C57E|nr:nicotinate-nucleotide--dimethylbenzimidazole phosphoribosyltransferase [Salsipaludibacter albus]MBY5164138.1 nicotinate-nucleotide--dimethylbenzimidazole phosphoribosyltransferase [Salsipaludibacter albus]
MSPRPVRTVGSLRAGVPSADAAAVAAASARSAVQAKPVGSLGRLEEVGAWLAGVAGTCPPPVPVAPAVVIAVGDHGVHAAGVSPWPQEVTAQMVGNFCAGGAAANALAATVGARMVVLDVGVAGDLPEDLPTARGDDPRLVRRRVRSGTRDLSREDAMTAGEVEDAILAGATVMDELVGDGIDLLVLGDMGIANTTASAALVAACTGVDPELATGRGTGIDDEMLARKTAIVRGALERIADRTDPLAVLAAIGGLEHAAMVGAMAAAATHRVPIVLDGVITDAAALVAIAWCPALAGHLVAGHRSVEPGAAVALDRLGLRPLLDLELRLGEGTGGLLAVPIVVAGAAALERMALLEDLG